MESFGTLTVYAYTSNARLPVEGATITVSQSCEENAPVLQSAVTDRSGYIPPLRVATPAPSEGLSPDQGVPFASVCILITHPNYETERISNVQVFPNIITVQNFQLVPANPLYGDEMLDYNTPNQNL